MICPKCGDKYEDDMPCCLWCDAPNPKYNQEVKQTECVEKFPPEKLDSKIESVLERKYNCINGFDFLEILGAQDSAKKTDDYVEFKITRSERINSILGMILILAVLLFLIVAVFFDDSMKNSWPLLVLPCAVFLFAFYVLSKTIFAVKWYKDKFILNTFYGDKEIPFNKLVLNCYEASDVGRFGVSIKKGRMSFVLCEQAFPEVARMLYRIYSCSTKKFKNVGEQGTEFVTYKPLERPCSRFFVFMQICIGLLLAVICLFNGIEGNIDSDWFCVLCFAVYFGVDAYRHSKTVLGIKWFKDRFVLCTRYGEKTFLFDKTELRKTKCNDNGVRTFIFRKNGMSFIVSERNFSEVAEMMRMLYGL